MAGRPGARLVYSTATGEVCARCGWPAARCVCSASSAAREPVPDRLVAKLRIEKAGRGGKIVTVVDGLPRNESFLKELSQELKRACGSGGTVRETSVEVQGDHRERILKYLRDKGYTVKG